VYAAKPITNMNAAEMLPNTPFGQTGPTLVVNETYNLTTPGPVTLENFRGTADSSEISPYPQPPVVLESEEIP
jgi:hypothetical protein